MFAFLGDGGLYLLYNIHIYREDLKNKKINFVYTGRIINHETKVSVSGRIRKYVSRVKLVYTGRIRKLYIIFRIYNVYTNFSFMFFDPPCIY